MEPTEREVMGEYIILAPIGTTKKIKEETGLSTVGGIEIVENAMIDGIYKVQKSAIFPPLHQLVTPKFNFQDEPEKPKQAPIAESYQPRRE